MSISLLEQETIVLFNRAEGEAEVFTYEPTLKRRLDDMADTFAEVRRVSDNGAGGITYMLPKKLITVRKPRPKKELTEKDKKERADRLALWRSAQKTTESTVIIQDETASRYKVSTEERSL